MRWSFRSPSVLQFRLSLLLTLSFAVPFFVYLATLTPSVTFGDSGEFLTQIATLGIPHPPGFPLYLLLARAFSLVPLGDFAMSVNLFSAFSGALTGLFVAASLWMLTRRWWIALFFPWLLVFFPLFWEQATMAEVYATNALFVSATLCSFLIWHETSKRRWLLVSALLFGLSISVHTMSALLGPGYLLALIAAPHFPRRSVRHWLEIAGMVVVGLLPYLYFPLRTQAHPPLQWQPVASAGDLFQYVTRQDYLPAVTADHPIFLERLRDGAQFLGLYLLEATDVLGPLLLTAALIGCVALYRRRRAYGMLLGIGTAFSVVSVIVLGANVFSSSWAEQYQVVFLHMLIPMVLLAGYGLHAVLDWMSHRVRPFPLHMPALILGVGIILLGVQHHGQQIAQQADRSGTLILERSMEQALEQMPPDGLLIFGNVGDLRDSLIFTLAYLQYVRNIRPDVLVINGSHYNRWMPDVMQYLRGFVGMTSEEGKVVDYFFLKSILAEAQRTGRPIVSMEPYAHTKLAYARSDGFLYRLFPSVEQAQAFRAILKPVPYTALLPAYPRQPLSDRESQLLATWYYNRALYFLQQGSGVRAEQTLGRALAYDPQPFSVQYYKYLAARDQRLRQEAAP